METTTEEPIPTDSPSLPAWVVVTICLVSLLLLLTCSGLYLKLHHPLLWRSLTRRLPVICKQSHYQVSPFSSCSPHRGSAALSACLQSISCKWNKSSQPSRDTCFLCMMKVKRKFSPFKPPSWPHLRCPRLSGRITGWSAR